MNLNDFNTLAQAQAHVDRTLKNPDERMLNERGIFSLIGMQDGEALMQAIEASISIPARVKSWFKPSEKGIDISDSSALAILAGMVSANVLTQANSDILSEYAYVTKQPFLLKTDHEFQLAKGTIPRVRVTLEQGYCRISVSATNPIEVHRPQISRRTVFANGDEKFDRVATFETISTAGLYEVACPNFGDLWVDNAYNVISQA
jgi:hypothetical protein